MSNSKPTRYLYHVRQIDMPLSRLARWAGAYYDILADTPLARRLLGVAAP